MPVYALVATSALAQQLQRWLQGTPFELRLFQSVTELLAQAQQIDEQFLILDYQYPELAAPQVIRLLRQQTTYPFTIILGESGDVSMAVEAHKVQVSLYLEKPFSKGTLLQHLYHWQDDAITG